jgi:hypothetical protein
VISKHGRLVEENHELQMFKTQTPIEIFVAMRDEVRYFVIYAGPHSIVDKHLVSSMLRCSYVEPIQEITSLYAAGKFIVVFTRSCHWFVS